VAYLFLCLLSVDMQEHANAAGEASRHGNLAGAEKGDERPAHLPSRQRWILRVQVVGDGKEGATNLLDWNLVGLDQPTQHFLRRGADRLARIRRRGGRAANAS